MILTVKLKDNSYDIVIEKGLLSNADTILDLNRKVLVVTDDGIPTDYADTIIKKCKTGIKYVLPMGENSKSLYYFEEILKLMLENNFTRKDAVVAVGGGVVGDLAGFCASCYMRGVDFFNIPTTLLSQVDSSIGGKTAVNFMGVKNVVGAFYQPKKVLIDTILLETLPERQIANGLAEALKMSLTSDKELFDIFEHKNIYENLDEIIIKSLEIKRDVVSKDEKEQGLRKILNFGHTIGHGIEATGDLYHGECVALGMIPMCSSEIKIRLKKILNKISLPTSWDFDLNEAIKAISHDKKADKDKIDVITVSEIGCYEIKAVTCEELKEIAKEVLK